MGGRRKNERMWTYTSNFNKHKKRERGREGRKEGKKDEEGEMAYIIEVLFIPLGNKSKL